MSSERESEFQRGVVAERERVTRIIREQREAIREAIEWPDGGGMPFTPENYYESATESVIAAVLVAVGVEDNQPGTTP